MESTPSLSSSYGVLLYVQPSVGNIPERYFFHTTQQGYCIKTLPKGILRKKLPVEWFLEEMKVVGLEDLSGPPLFFSVEDQRITAAVFVIYVDEIVAREITNKAVRWRTQKNIDDTLGPDYPDQERAIMAAYQQWKAQEETRSTQVALAA